MGRGIDVFFQISSLFRVAGSSVLNGRANRARYLYREIGTDSGKRIILFLRGIVFALRFLCVCSAREMSKECTM